MPDAKRPTRVVVVDADNPLNEVRGEFFWREDHERLLESARDLAYQAGYEQGFAAGSTRDFGRVQFMLVRRSSNAVRRMLGALVAMAFLALLIGAMLR